MPLLPYLPFQEFNLSKSHLTFLSFSPSFSPSFTHSLSLSLSLSFFLSFSLSLSPVVGRPFIMLISTINLSMRFAFGGDAAHHLRSLKSLQKKTVKFIVKISSNDVFKGACLLLLESLTDFQRSLLIMKLINDKVPQYMKTLFTLCPYGNNQPRLPPPWLDIFKSYSISFSAVMSWNSLSINLRSSIRPISLINLKRKLGSYLFSKV